MGVEREKRADDFTFANVEFEVPLKHSGGVMPSAVECTNVEFRREICARGTDSGVIAMETEWMRFPRDNVKNKKSRSLDETLNGIVKFIEWEEEEELIKKT